MEGVEDSDRNTWNLGKSHYTGGQLNPHPLAEPVSNALTLRAWIRRFGRKRVVKQRVNRAQLGFLAEHRVHVAHADNNASL